MTRDNEGVEKTWERILDNRKNGLEYDQTGDVVRYAGDIIDYMEIANLLKTYDSRTYYLNTLEEEAIVKFCESTEWFAEYDEMIEKRSGTMEEVKECVAGWFSFVNRDIQNTDFATDILAYIASDEDELKSLKDNASYIGGDPIHIEFTTREKVLDERIAMDYDVFTTKDILEMDWNTFLLNKKWHSRMMAWNLTLTRKLQEQCTIIYERNNDC